MKGADEITAAARQLLADAIAAGGAGPAVAAPELAAHTGAMFSQDGAAALPTPEMKNAAHVAAMISAVDALQARAEGAGCGAGKA